MLNVFVNIVNHHLADILFVIIFAVMLMVCIRLKLRCDVYKNGICLNEGILYNFFGGYYVWDAVNRVEKFAPCEGMDDWVFYSLEIFAENFEESEYLKRTIAESKIGKIKKDLILTCRHKELRYRCQIRTIFSANSDQIIGSVMFMHDVSREFNSLDMLDMELRKLRKELSIKDLLLDSASYLMWVCEKDDLVYENKEFKNMLCHENAAFLYPSECSDIKHDIIVDNKRKSFKISKFIKNNKLFGYAHNATEEDFLESKLNSKSIILEKLINNISAGIAIYGVDSKLVLYNASFMKLWELKSVFLDSRPSYNRVMDNLVCAGRIDRYEWLDSFSSITMKKIFNLRIKIEISMIVIPCQYGETIFIYEQ